MKRMIIKYVSKEEMEKLREKYKKAQCSESKKYVKLRISSRQEVRCLK